MSKIFDFVKPSVVTGDTVQEIFHVAKKHKCALPAVNCIGTDSINAALETAAKVKSPIIIQFSYGGSIFIAGKGLHNINSFETAIYGAIAGANYVHMMAPYYGVPVILNTDHCSKEHLPWIEGLLNAGYSHFINTGVPLFSSHMLDFSKETLIDNIHLCGEYLKKMIKMKMTLEIELGITGGEEDGVNNLDIDSKALYTSPEDVNYAYTKLTEINHRFIIAAAFGNVHGVYKPGNVKLMPIILKESQEYISKKHNLPHNSLSFVFHGGSGSSISEIKESLNYGIVKMNIDTDTQWANWNGVLQYYKNNKNFLQNQIGNIKGEDIPNKKYYDPRIWLREGQLSTVARLEKTFCDLNAVNLF